MMRGPRVLLIALSVLLSSAVVCVHAVVREARTQTVYMHAGAAEALRFSELDASHYRLGRTLVSGDPLYTRANGGKLAGYAGRHCVTTALDAALDKADYDTLSGTPRYLADHTYSGSRGMLECFMVLSLADGDVALHGRVERRFNETSVVAITGGTGDYINIRGEAVLTAVDAASCATKAFGPYSAPSDCVLKVSLNFGFATTGVALPVALEELAGAQETTRFAEVAASTWKVGDRLVFGNPVRPAGSLADAQGWSSGSCYEIYLASSDPRYATVQATTGARFHPRSGADALNGALLCQVSIAFDKAGRDTVTLHGIVESDVATNSSLAITGGTGAYANVKGFAVRSARDPLRCRNFGGLASSLPSDCVLRLDLGIIRDANAVAEGRVESFFWIEDGGANVGVNFAEVHASLFKLGAVLPFSCPLRNDTTAAGVRAVRVGRDNGYCYKNYLDKVWDQADYLAMSKLPGAHTRPQPLQWAGSWECMWTSCFDDGCITVEGAFADDVRTTNYFTVLGGTGAYIGATGMMVDVLTNPNECFTTGFLDTSPATACQYNKTVTLYYPDQLSAAQLNALSTADGHLHRKRTVEQTASVDCAVNEVEYQLGPNGEGALIDMRISSVVGILLTDFPESDRARVAAKLIAQPESYWKEQARRQMHYNDYTLTYREANYAPWTQKFNDGNNWYSKKKQLALPIQYQWNYTFFGKPTRGLWQADKFAPLLDAVYVAYELNTMIVTDYRSPEISDNAFRIGGSWYAEEPLEMPLDPNNMYARIGFACNDDWTYALNTYDPAYPWGVFDFHAVASSCKPDDSNEISCSYYHCSKPCPIYDCVEALDLFTGRVSTKVRATRLPWDPVIAAKWRSEPLPTTNGVNLIGWDRDLEQTYEIYRYFEHGKAVELDPGEGTVPSAGWHQLVQYTGTNSNTGIRQLDISAFPWQYFVGDNNSALCDYHGLYVYNNAHGHCHFGNYTKIQYNIGRQMAAGNQKRGFCVVSVYRQRNWITSPMTSLYAWCSQQGMSAGWGDMYQVGVSGQWVVVTNLTAGSGVITVTENAWNMVCEGVQQCASDGTTKLFENRADISAEIWKCRHPASDPDPALDNPRSTPNVNHYGCGRGYVTEPSQYGPLQELGPLHDSDHVLLGNVQLRTCTPFRNYTLTCTLPKRSKVNALTVTDSQVVRVCESSRQLGCGTACRAMPGGHDNEGAKAILTIDDVKRTASTVFTCPGPRGLVGNPGYEPGGYYSLYAAMLAPVPGGDTPNAQCTVTLNN
jgi:hypothetical protein